jgi:hypothetical protein
MNEDIRGKGAVGIAIAYYSLNGMVSLPLSPCDYNLVFDDSIGLRKIKVISSSYKKPSGSFAANIRSSGGNQSSTQVKKFDKDSCDYVFVLTSDFDMYSIPSQEIHSEREITLSQYTKFKVNIIPE